MEKDKSVIGTIKILDTIIGKKGFELAKSMDGGRFCVGHLQFEILKYLFEHDGEVITQSDLEKHLHISKTAISDAVISMEKQGTIERTQSKSDKRANNIRQTKKSEEMFEKMKTLHAKTNELLVKGISKSELQIFYKVISKMISNLQGE